MQPAIVKAEDYVIDPKCVATGAWGTVHRATKKQTGELVAMKFFGYTKNQPVNRMISAEVMCMMKLVGVSGAVQIIGIFRDTKLGLVPNKNKKFCDCYPVIVMEYLAGGDMFSMVTRRIEQNLPVNEKVLAIAFKSVITSLLSIHKQNFLHRDLKLDNLVLSSNDSNAVVKVVDCGYFCRASGGVVYETQLVGSPGYFAPESLKTKAGLREYSFKSDVWQAGCALYIMLTAKLPFSQKKEDFQTIIEGKYFSLDAAVWRGISSSAKDLVSRMLRKNAEQRISVEDVLRHPWLSNIDNLPSYSLANGYTLRIKGMEVERKLKMGFLAGKIEENHKTLKQRLQIELQFLNESSQCCKDKDELDMEAISVLSGEEFQSKLKELKNIVMARVISNSTTNANDELEKDQVYLVPPLKRRKSAYDEEINFADFRKLLELCNLQCLLSERIFRVFDTDGDEKLNMKEFLFALIALKSLETSKDVSDSTDAADLYFHFFDLDGDGYIGVEEMVLAFNFLFRDCNIGSYHTTKDGFINTVKVFDAANLFQQIEKKNFQRIDLNEFKKFYNKVLTATVSQNQSMAQ